jgi:hypothetical protein
MQQKKEIIHRTKMSNHVIPAIRDNIFWQYFILGLIGSILSINEKIIYINPTTGYCG